MKFSTDYEYMDKRCREGSSANLFLFWDDEEMRVHYMLENDEEILFIIKKGLPLDPKHEDLLVMILLESCVVADERVDFVTMCIAKEWGLPHIASKWQICLLQLYYAFCKRDSLFELLSKINLELVFEKVVDGTIVELDHNASNIRDAMDLPPKVLRCFDTLHGIKFIRTAEQRQQISKIYTRYYYLLHRGVKLSEHQIKYLLQNRDAYISVEQFQKLGMYTREEQTMLDDYLKVAEKARELYQSLPRYPSSEELPYAYKIATTVNGLIKNEALLDKMMSENKMISNHGLVDCTVPSTVREFIRYAALFRNCLYEYPVKILLGDNEILIVILEDRVCVELIRIGDIYILREALGRMNKALSEEETNVALRFVHKNKIKVV